MNTSIYNEQFSCFCKNFARTANLLLNSPKKTFNSTCSTQLVIDKLVFVLQFAAGWRSQWVLTKKKSSICHGYHDNFLRLTHTCRCPDSWLCTETAWYGAIKCGCLHSVQFVWMLHSGKGNTRQIIHRRAIDVTNERFKASATTLVRYARFWDITKRRVVILYRRFETTYRSRLQGSRSLPWRWDRYVVPKRR
jgi:hypothetical protein